MRRSDAARELFSKYGLIVMLLVLPVYFGIQDLSDDGNLTRLGNNLIEGLSNGAILALIALGYTLVYGIIELINFAHGEIFMLGLVRGLRHVGRVRPDRGHRHPRPDRRPGAPPWSCACWSAAR